MAAIINWTPAGKILKLVWQEPAAFYPHLGTTKTAFVFHLSLSRVGVVAGDGNRFTEVITNALLCAVLTKNDNP